jgi:hypothetical protein
MHDLMIPLVTVPTLALLLTVRTTGRLLNQVGQWSEEIFRGHRLPPLDASGDASEDASLDASELGVGGGLPETAVEKRH